MGNAQKLIMPYKFIIINILKNKQKYRRTSVRVL